MLRTLRNRLILSHVLPLLIIVPLLGVVLIYLLETQFLIPSLTRNLTDDAKLITELARDHQEIWNNPAFARGLLSRLDPDRAEQILLFDRNGQLIAATGSEQAQGINIQIDPGSLEKVKQGQVVSSQAYQQQFRAELIDVIAPVASGGGEIIGIVRLTYRYDTFYQEFLNLRYLIGTVILISLVIGTVLGSVLAVNIGAPIQQVTQAVYDLASGFSSELLPERGPEEVRQLQRAANQLFKRLRTLEDSRRKLLANLVHELGRPMGALRAAIQALMRGAKDDPQLMEELLEGMDEEAVRLQRLTENLAELHDQVLGTLELECREVSLSEWLPRMLSSWKESAREREIYWETDLPHDLPVIWADPERFGQAIGNLVSNALKYTPPGGHVNVEAGSEKDEVWVRVSDTGPGIPKEEQDKIFLPFYRGSYGSRFQQGMGLGLSITRDLIQAHKGRIELESEPGSGSRFTVWLPIGF